MLGFIEIDHHIPAEDDVEWPAHRPVAPRTSSAQGDRRATTRNSASPSSGQIIIQGVAPTGYSIPADAELRRYFSGRGLSDDQVEANIRQFANRTVNRSLQALQHAWALKHLAERFSPDQLSELSPEARAKWVAMLNVHAAALQNETAALRRELGPVFFPSAPEDGPRMELGNDQKLAAAIDRLLNLCSANDKVIRYSDDNAFLRASRPFRALIPCRRETSGT